MKVFIRVIDYRVLSTKVDLIKHKVINIAILSTTLIISRTFGQAIKRALIYGSERCGIFNGMGLVFRIPYRKVWDIPYSHWVFNKYII